MEIVHFTIKELKQYLKKTPPTTATNRSKVSSKKHTKWNDNGDSQRDREREREREKERES